MLYFMPTAILRLLIQLSTRFRESLSYLPDFSFSIHSLPYNIFILFISLVVFYMVFPILQGLLSRSWRSTPSQDIHVGDTGNHRPTEGLSTSLVRSARRQCRPSQTSTRLVTSKDGPPGTSNPPGKCIDTKSRHQSLPQLDTAHSSGVQLFKDEVLRESPIQQDATVLNISNLPMEILTIIFQHAFPPPKTFPDRFTPSPLLLRQVCQSWKSVIEDTSAFWLSLYPPSKSPKDSETLAIVDWYKRVTTTMSEKVTAFDHLVIELPQEKAQMCGDLLHHLLINLAPRSVAMKLDIPSRLLRELETVALLNSSTPLLEAPKHRRRSDSISMEPLRTVDWTLPLHSFGQQFPLDLGLPWTSLRRLPWTQLVHVTLDLSMTLEDCIFILNNVSAIEKLSLKLVSGEEPLPATTSRTQRKSLAHLYSFTMGAEVSITSLFRQFDMPHLCDLDLDLGGFDTAVHLPQLNVPWARLTRLALNCFLPMDVMENIIAQLCPIVILELRLKGGPLDDYTWTTTPAVLSSLKSFTLVHAGEATLMSQHIFPASIESIDAPLIPIPLAPTTNNPFHSLKTVKLSESITPSDFLSLLTFAASLKQGAFVVRDTTSESYSPSTLQPPPTSPPLFSFQMTRSRVTDLDLHLDFQDNSAQPLLDALILPNLISFKLKASRKSSDCNSLYSLLERSHCHLVSLSLNCSSLPDSGAVRLMHLLSSTLEEFRIDTDPFAAGLGSEFCQGLTHEDAGLLTKCLCPRLERLDLWPCGDAPTFYKMVRSRSNSFGACNCGMKRLKHVGAGLPDSERNCSKFAQFLKSVGIKSDIKSFQ